MSLYIKISDLKAQTQVAKNIFTTTPMQDYLDKFEVRYLQDLLGCELYEAFKTDFAIIGTEPTDPKFKEIWGPFCIDDACAGIHRSEGIKEMLALFIYFEWLRDQKTKNNISGPQENQQANSESAPFSLTNIYTNYNEALETYWAIQWIICDNPNNFDWDEYNGQHKGAIGFV